MSLAGPGEAQADRKPKLTYASALSGSVDQRLAEDIVALAGISGLVDNDLLVVIGELEDDVLVLLAQLEVVEGRYALLVDGRSIKWFR